jgi:maleamate amidohydrolase
MKAFTDASLPLGADLESQLTEINRLLDAAHSANLPVYFSLVCYDEPDCRDAGIWGAKVTSLHDAVFVKKYASCFFGTDLVSRLQSRRVDTLIITGCTTSGCVRASAVDAIQYGFRPIVVRDAVGDRSKPAHDQSLFDIQAKYGDVMSAGAVLQKIAAAVART